MASYLGRTWKRNPRRLLNKILNKLDPYKQKSRTIRWRPEKQIKKLHAELPFTVDWLIQDFDEKEWRHFQTNKASAIAAYCNEKHPLPKRVACLV